MKDDPMLNNTPDYSSQIDPRWAWHYRTLQGLRSRLLRDRDQHRLETVELTETGGSDLTDVASDQSERDVLVAELRAEQDMLTEVTAAIGRIHAGKYGICEATRKTIAPERLQALPWTRLSREAAATQEGKVYARSAFRR